MDALTPEQRSENMRWIHAVKTGQQSEIRKLLRQAGIRVRSYPKSIPGHPHFVVVGLRAATSVSGCFYRWMRGRRPKSNLAYGNAKLERNAHVFARECGARLPATAQL